MGDFTASDHFVKICGITNEHDALGAAELGASAIGLIFSDSQRRVNIETATAIVSAIGGGVTCVGVVRDEPSRYVIDCIEATHVDAVQVHGVLDDVLLGVLRDRGVSIIKALSVDSEELLTFDDHLVDAVLIDGPTPGSGTPHSWQRLGIRTFGVPVIAAGGLTPDNVAEVISQLKPWGVDVATGVEASPGVKDLTRVRDFVHAAQQAFVNGEAK
ncbi:MAG: phosphoribosylanthranilate isomerase [Acidimicrobiales bacterium]